MGRGDGEENGKGNYFIKVMRHRGWFEPLGDGQGDASYSERNWRAILRLNTPFEKKRIDSCFDSSPLRRR